jgi:hypothetical protein
MKLLKELFSVRTHKKKTVEEYKEEMVEKLAREQFRQLAEKGLSLPVALL